MGRPVDATEFSERDATSANELAQLSPEILWQQKEMAASVKLAVSRVDRYMPWGTECYTQALTAKLMLRRRGVPTVLLVGFRKSEKGEIQGHAWLKIGPYFITGFRHDMDTYVVNGKFL
jgi:hypothetical protein